MYPDIACSVTWDEVHMALLRPVDAPSGLVQSSSPEEPMVYFA